MALAPIPCRFYISLGAMGLLISLFIMVPASMRGGFWSTSFLVAMTIVWGLHLLILGVSFRRNIAVRDGRLVVKSTFYSIEVPASQITDVRRVPDERRVALQYRSNGVGMPGLWSGWFRGDGEKYFVDVVKSPNVALDTSSGTTIVLEVRDPAAFRDALGGSIPDSTHEARPDRKN
ncbi:MULTISPECIES: PH domain-containing protein [Azotobacter]|uniref:PH domain-containing protein n=1 Tax=Azotobacter TaxID=352 RepID=UPI0000526E8C|nr:PH domain-containing protein [Azotobacter vinelandii]GLK59359.1 hypothetical protein GCM10017624_15160 [Azotobacter vinelandii]SFX29686.1 PH domain-containing protein [Azotobacter vinelandii]